MDGELDLELEELGMWNAPSMTARIRSSSHMDSRHILADSQDSC